MSFIIDGIPWDVPCSVKRTAEMTASEISGMLLDKTYFNDVIGTYMSYTVALAVPFDMENEYAALYDMLTDPVAFHSMTFPYNGEDLNINARIQVVSDDYVRQPNNGRYWRNTEFTAIATAPTRTYTLSEAITYGMPELPDAVAPGVGDTYTYNGSEWEVTDYDDADNTQY